MRNITRKLATIGAVAAVAMTGAVTGSQYAGAANGTPTNPVTQPDKANPKPDGANCWAWGQCAILSNFGTTDIWMDGKIDNVYARTRILPAGHKMSWGDRWPVEGFWLATGDCAWTRDANTVKWTSYWGSKTRYTYVHQDDFDMWEIYKKPCGSST